MKFTDKSKTSRTFTKDGYLVVPATLSKVGVFDYLATELGEQGEGIKKVARTEQSLFSDETIASFEGMPLTLGHPKEDVTAKNWKQLAVGTVRNVKREGDMLAGEAWIYDELAIKTVQEHGIDELSCGYSCGVKPSVQDGVDFEFLPMVGNHVAIVANGRCGNQVKLADEGKRMSQTRKILDAVLGAFGIKLTDEQAKKVDEEEKKEQGNEEGKQAPEPKPESKPSESKPEEGKQSNPDDEEEKEKKAVKDTALEKENAELKAKIQKMEDEQKANVERAKVVADVAASFPELQFGDTDSVRQIQEKAILDQSLATVDELKGYSDEAISGMYAIAKKAKKADVGTALGKKLIGDSAPAQTVGADFNKLYGGK